MKYEDPKHTMAGQDNNEKFNALLNSCAYPRQIYNALLALSETGVTMDGLKQKEWDHAHT